ncbi:MAG: DDE-type integrase/transposase/recombinase [Bryobacterales bacterium]|nr:DDE-type integrase/transposase/recombinase [Bryobacterales bacterium]
MSDFTTADCVTPARYVALTTERYANNRMEASHQPTRQRERQIRRFKSTVQAQRFHSLHGVVHNLFRLGRL